MKKSALLAILVLVLAVSTGVLGYLYSTETVTGQDVVVSPSVAIGDYTQKWASSAHANSASEGFRHWDDSEDGTVPANCAQCHSSTGFLDYYGLDGSEAYVVDQPAKVGTVVDCSVCHNDYVESNPVVKFPSGMEVASTDGVAACWTCHQGTEGGINGNLEKRIGEIAPDDKGETLGFVNPHYLAVGSMYLGAEANGGYQYEGKTYAGAFRHASGVETCTDCHDPHTLHLADPGYEKCQTCHAEIQGYPDQRLVRRTRLDYDGDGDVNESTYDEINGLAEQALASIVTYSKNIGGVTIGYSDNYPYWFGDVNDNGVQDEGEKAYADWTPRLMRAAFNYKFVTRSAGYIHNPVYSAQLLIDSIEDLAAGDATITLASYSRP